MTRGIALLCAVAVVGAGASVVLAGNDTGQIVGPTRTPDVVTATGATLSCPESPRTKQTETSLLAVTPLAPDDEASTSDQGAGDVSVLAKDEPVVLEELASRGTPIALDLTPADRPATVVRASEAYAPGLAAAQWSTARKDAGNGLAASLCQPAAEEWNFAGVSTAVGATSRLVVTNPTPAVAVFDLTFFGPEGKVDAIGARGLALAPQSRESYDLAQFAPGVEAMALSLSVDSGRVVAAVHTDLVEGNEAFGSEWLPAGQPPATEVLVNAGFANGTDQQLQIANPTDRQALVQVQIVAGDGPFAPTKMKDLQIEPFSVHRERLTELLDKEESAVHISSTTPVTAAIVDESAEVEDFAVSGSSPAIDGAAVVAMIPDADLTLALSSQEREGGEVEVVGYADDGSSVDRSSINFKGFRTKTWEPTEQMAKKASYLVVSMPEPIEVHGVAQYDGPAGLTSLPIVSGVYTLSKPDVAPAP